MRRSAMLRFFIALWAAKLMMLYYRLRGTPKTDMPGLLACKLCPNFLELISKPELTIAITGTNGKTTTSALVNDFLRAQGYSTSFNDWGANLMAGFATNLIRGVGFFNKPRVDCSVLEADELSMDSEMSKIKPNYILVTNICKDSLRRNGHPENIFNHIESCMLEAGKDTVAILNANDPISSELGKTARRVYFGIEDDGFNPRSNISRDISVCPKCGGKIAYDYRLYRHIGKFSCTDCDFRTPESKYTAGNIDLDNKKMQLNGETVPLISDTMFNCFNVLSAAALFMELGYGSDVIADFLKGQKITDIRESSVVYKGIEYYAYAAKSQNVSAASTVFEYMAEEPSMKNVVLLMDEVQDRHHPTETISWLYETDYEFLNSPNIKKIIVGGHMYLNHKLRMLLAGIPGEKLVAVETEAEIPENVDTEGIEKVYVLYEIDYVTKAKNMRDSIVNYAKGIKQ